MTGHISKDDNGMFEALVYGFATIGVTVTLSAILFFVGSLVRGELGEHVGNLVLPVAVIGFASSPFVVVWRLIYG